MDHWTGVLLSKGTQSYPGFRVLFNSTRRDWNLQDSPQNIYNMDEKGIQMGVGKRSLVLVDRDQKLVQQLEDGDRELVTVIEAVSADGFALLPSVIFKGKRRDLAWGRVNPCNARHAIRFSSGTPCLTSNKYFRLPKWLDGYGAGPIMADERLRARECCKEFG
jgi:hypothetical protein